MLNYEKIAWQNNLFVCGIDEVGRGCLAGPLVTACVILPINKKHKLLKDSKILTEQERELAYSWLIDNSYYSTSIVDNYIIDKINIYQATLLAMKKSVLQLFSNNLIKKELVKYILIDAMPVKLDITDKHDNLEILNFNKGEKYSISIAAASIVAKVTRDRLMKKISPIFINFNLDEHKGYGTKIHTDNLKKFGSTIIHRKTFLNNLDKEKNESKQQLTIF